MDHQQIQTVISLYSDCMYARDWDRVPSLFTSDARWEIEGTDYVMEGDAVAPGLRGFGESAALLLQILSPAIIEIDGDEASARSSVHEVVDNAASGTTLKIYGIYFDRFRKVDGEWRFSARRFRQLKMSVEPYEAPAA